MARQKPSFPQLNRSHPLAQGLVLDMPFFENSGTRTNDLILGQSFSLTNATWGSGNDGAYVSFNGTTAYINAGHSAIQTVGKYITIYAKVWMNSFDGTYRTIAAKSNNSGGGGNKVFSIGVGAVNGAYSELWVGGVAKLINSTSLPTGQWVDYFLTYNGATITEQINSTIATLAATGTVDTQAALDLIIGAHYTPGLSAAEFWNGRIAFLRMWNVPMNLQERNSLRADPFQIYKKKTPLAEFAAYVTAPGLQTIFGDGLFS